MPLNLVLHKDIEAGDTALPKGRNIYEAVSTSLPCSVQLRKSTNLQVNMLCDNLFLCLIKKGEMLLNCFQFATPQACTGCRKMITWRDSSKKAIWNQETSSTSHLQMGCSTRPSDLWTVTSQPPLTPSGVPWGSSIVCEEVSWSLCKGQSIMYHGPDHVSRVKDDTSKENRLPLLSRD